MKIIHQAILLFVIICCVISENAMAITRSLTYNGSTLSTAVNTTQTVAQHTADMTLSSAIDYTITAGEGQTAMTARVNITNDRATVVFANIRPSEVTASWLKFISVNGAQAVDGTNCRVETYRHGTIVLPYSLTCHPLTVYKETAQQGESNSEYEVNAYYDRLGDFDNAINSFTLKRGYMVTMANHADGTGYSHCFIANDGDITVTLPKDMRGSVSFLRILRWRWPSKKGYAGRTPTPMGLMRVTWFYQWNAENYVESNYDYVPQRHHETGSTYTGNATWAWPSWDALNNQTSAHVLGANEPDNTSGSEMYMTVDNLIRLHADYLRSGMRIGTFACCNPNTAWVKAYVDSCEAHNYRVDFVATHYYIGGQTPEACINSLKSLYNATGLPVWCTEWNNGANWTSESQFYTDTKKAWYQWGSGNDQEMNGIWLTDVLRRADYSENTEWLERFAVYNNVEQKRFVHWESDDFWTTAGGDIYGAYNSDFAYKKTSDVWMDWRDQGNPRHLAGGYAADGEHINLMWSDPNTDWTKTVYVQQQTSGSVWTARATLGVSDDMGRSASLAVADCPGKKVFRIACVDAKGQYHYSNTIDLTATDVPNGYAKITSLPDNCEDFYYVVSSKANTALCWTLDNASPTDDYTSLVGTSKEAWSGASGTVTGNGIGLVELYNSASAGTKMQQTVAVPNGIYKAVLYATSHNARGENGATLNGTRDDVAYVFATTSGNTKKTYFTASGVTPGFLSNEPLECVVSDIRVTDGTLTLGLGLDLANITGWHCIQIKSLTRTGDIEGVSAGVSSFKSVHYAAPSEAGSNLAQVWQIEPNAAGGYAIRCPAQYDDVLCGTLFQTDGKTHVGTAASAFMPVYDASADCWRIKHVASDTYCGVGGTPSAGDEVAGNKSQGQADQLVIYAVRKADFNQWYIADHHHTEATYTIANPNLSWGTAIGSPSGGGRVEYPVRWNFQHRFEGWNDAFMGTAALSDGHTGTFFNAWAGTLNYAELSQEVRHLPNGVYRLTADFATTNGYSRTTSRTALYANAGEGNISRSYNITGTGDNAFNPYECYVLVKDNKMTVGARSDGTWFKVADFRLEYVCAEGEATDDIRGWLDNGRALQHQCWRMGDAWLDLSGFPECRNLQVDQIPDNALIKIAPGATVDAAYHPKNIIQDGKCALWVITDEAPLEVLESFEAAEVRYERHDEAGEWHELFLPFALTSSQGVKVAQVVGVDGTKLRCLVSSASQPNVPALVRFDDASLVLKNISALPTAEYGDEETRLQGTYRDGGTVRPLRWNAEAAESFSDLTLIFIGDVNRDGNINIADVMGAVVVAIGNDDAAPHLFDHDAADFNNDTTVNITDVMAIVSYVLNGR
jgi:hypothetical protein